MAMSTRSRYMTWEFPEIRGTLLWGPYNKDPFFGGGTMLGSPILGNPHMDLDGLLGGSGGL